ncbi:hypothetical protein HK099_000927 [Clydaea vesicula]|uniref:RhoGAP-domain-containing protein n=1 Tax=Clydaea vesicula TaxID=447962 RepID=A0AAD5TX95_9FUNG|nr:hypothetical protein HK099_000927 [Clydaea vesicula]
MNNVYEPVSGTMQTQQNVDLLLSNVILERNTLRQQNEQLWKIIEKQKLQIAQLQEFNKEMNGRKSINGRERQKSGHPPSTQERYKIDQQLPIIAPAKGSSSNNSLQKTPTSTALPAVPSANQPNYLGTQSYSGGNSGIINDNKNINSSPSLSADYNYGGFLPKLDTQNSFNKLTKTEFDAIAARDSATRESECQNPPTDTRRLSSNLKRPRFINDELTQSQRNARENSFSESNNVEQQPPELSSDNSKGVMDTTSDENEETLTKNDPETTIELTKSSSSNTLLKLNPESVENFENINITFLDQSKVKKSGGKEQHLLTFKISANDAQKTEYWRCEKLYSDLFVFDIKIHSSHPQEILSQLRRVPEKSLFQGNLSEQKLIHGKQSLDNYLQKLIKVLSTDSDVLNFFKTDIVEEKSKVLQDDEKKYTKSNDEMDTKESSNPAQKEINLFKEGYLTKKGKGFGGYTWKKKYFVLRSGLMDCYETNDTTTQTTGTIKLKYCTVEKKIGHESDPELKFSICITEYKKDTFKFKANPPLQDAKVNCKYVLHCVNEDDCEEWISSIQENINLVRPAAIDTIPLEKNNEKTVVSNGLVSPEPPEANENPEQATAVPPATPPISPTQPLNLRPNSPTRHFLSTPSNVKDNQIGKVDENERIMKQATLPISSIFDNGSLPTTNLSQYQQGSSLSLNKNKDGKRKDGNEKKINKRMTNFFSGKKKNEKVTSDTTEPARLVFGVSLEKCLQISKITENFELPSIVYRCIEYLDAKDAIKEEGIFRLSGSSVEIQKLKERFNNEGDVDLVNNGEFYDVHAIAGLLKLWFRELASPVLTSEKQKDFVQLLEIGDRNEKIKALKKLCSQLPRSNYTLIRSLVGHLIKVVQNSAINKMTVKNVGIVFAPTLSVPAGIFTLMMAEYDIIFSWDGLNESEIERQQFSILPLETNSYVEENNKNNLESNNEENNEDEEVLVRKRPPKPGGRKKVDASHSMIYESDVVNIINTENYENNVEKVVEERDSTVLLRPHEPFRPEGTNEENVKRPRSSKIQQQILRQSSTQQNHQKPQKQQQQQQEFYLRQDTMEDKEFENETIVDHANILQKNEEFHFPNFQVSGSPDSSVKDNELLVIDD